MASPNIEFLRRLRGGHGFERALAFLHKLKSFEQMQRHGVKDSKNKLHCNALFLVLMKRAYDRKEHECKEKLVRFFLGLGLSVLCSGVDQVGDSCLKYTDDLSPKTFAALRNVYLLEYKKVFPSEYAAQTSAMRLNAQAVEAAKILTDIKVGEAV